MRTLFRGAIAWLLIMAGEVLHGIARTLYLQPIVGDFRARQIAVFTGSALISTIALLTIRWIAPPRASDAIRVGLLWLVLTLAFEVAFGRFVVHASWARIASDYDVPHGGLLPFGLLVMALAPLGAAKLRDGRWS
jgi:hypothetical protein